MLRHIFKKSAFIIVILCTSALIFLAYRFWTSNIKARLLQLSKEALNTEVFIGQAYLRFPACLELKDIKVSNSIDIPSVRIYPSHTSFFIKNKLVISRISVINPVIRIKKEDAAKWSVADFSKIKAQDQVRDFLLPGLSLSRIYLHDGTVMYDKGGDNELEFIGIKGDIESPGFYFSKDNAVNFAMSGFLKNKETDFLSPVKISGRAAADSTIKVRLEIDDIKIATLGATYDKFLSRVIREGRFDLDSDIQISKTSLTAKCLLEGEDIIFKKGLDKEMESSLLASFVLFLSFKNKLLKFKNIQGNLFKLILNRS